MNKTILLTGAAGFIGFHLTKRLCADGYSVIGIDNLNDYYDPQLKLDRLAELEKHTNFTFFKLDLSDKESIFKLFEEHSPNIVLHMGAQAGVRYSLDNPYAYIDSNVTGTLAILEGCRHFNVEHLIFASSSSVYGANTKTPFDEDDPVDHPVSLYAATKKATEMMAHSYAHLYDVPCTGLRFFTVYGPWGRPDMAYFKFMDKMVKGNSIDVYNHGDMKRDFTYIDDIVEGIMQLLDKVPEANTADNTAPSAAKAPYRIYNIGNNEPESLLDMIKTLEEESGLKAKTNMLPMQPGDVYETYASTDKLSELTGFKPHTPLREGLRHFINWYRDYYGLGNGPEET